ncbi:unnamed protein product [Spirodela intermedia]|uniref:Uncharacterized protein n=1 Tax=Spirodela intermedia TaxID=51605 RepID=A0A7I8JC95_SPIIN|nr:unnamed protein product [Spirodela intermedia]CAA6667808.1 unnamed protein product [Spirodela intermedia]
MIGGGCGMFASCLRWRRQRRSVGRSGDQDLAPVLLVSGMGGSILNARNKETGAELRVWVRLLLADLEFRKLWSLFNPETGCTECLDPHIEIVVPDDDYGLYAIDILDPSWFTKLVHLTDVYHFHDMIDMLIGCGYQKGTTLFGFGYDFRKATVISALKEKLITAYKASGGKKVEIISHSMGGLLVRCFLSLHKDVFEKYVSKWICIATPFQGAPGYINDCLLTGLQFVDGFESFFFVSRWTMHQLLVECPSIYEMLPNPEFKWKRKPLINVWRKQPDSKDGSVVKLDTYDSTESTTLFEEALRNNEVKYNGKSVPVPFNLSILKWAADTRKTLEHASLPENVSFYSIYGTSFDTPFDVSYGSEDSPIGDLSEVCHTTPEYSYVDGDGTVPAESAKADGLPAAARMGVPANHRGLLRTRPCSNCLNSGLGLTRRAPWLCPRPRWRTPPQGD